MKPGKAIDVILPLPLRGTYSYAVSEEQWGLLQPGMRVLVSFGQNKLYSGVYLQETERISKGNVLKPIESILDQEPVVTALQLRQWKWMSDYYICGIGEVMNAALPAALKLSSETRFYLSGNEIVWSDLEEQEKMIVAGLENEETLSLSDINKLLERKNAYPLVRKMIKAGLLEVVEEVKEDYKPKKKRFVELQPKFASEKGMELAFNELSRAPKQLEVMMRFVEMGRVFSENPVPVLATDLQKMASADSSVLLRLQEKGIFRISERAFYGVQDEGEIASLPELSPMQMTAFDEVKTVFRSLETCLLHGITSSGKTLVYLHLAREYISAGKQVLYLVPEIALTTQLITRLKHFFGNRVGVYHSRFNANERTALWESLLKPDCPYDIIIGARSAVFLPFQHLGLVIVDEEHDPSYKQMEPAPYYHARDTSIVVAAHHGAKTILGSATPALETMHHAEKGKYGLVQMNKRFGDIGLPAFEVVDLRKAHRDKKMNGHFSETLMERIRETLAEKKQVILFQNRRGFAPFIICEQCGWTGNCVNCDITLTYHKFFENLICHYCGYKIDNPTKCPSCASARLTLKGFGTEKIEDDLAIMLPEHRIGRMDLDTTRKKNAYNLIIQEFEERSLDILVGTQMITKGLDFENVGLVGVLNADSLWSRPDFRSFERSFQVLTQVAGRAGRKGKRGKVVVQAFNAEHPLLAYVTGNDYKRFYEHGIQERLQFLYPPFTRLVRFAVSHRDPHFAKEAAGYLAQMLREKFANRVLGPEEPPVARIRNRYYRHILLKLERGLSVVKVRQAIVQIMDVMEGNVEYRKARVQIDVDPY